MPSLTYFNRRMSASKEILRTDSPHRADQEGNRHTHTAVIQMHTGAHLLLKWLRSAEQEGSGNIPLPQRSGFTWDGGNEESAPLLNSLTLTQYTKLQVYRAVC